MIRSGPALGLIAAAALILTSSPVRAEVRTEVLQPISPWHVSWEDRSCVMRRAFGSADNPFIIQFERFGPHDEFQLVLLGKWLSNLSYPDKLAIEYGDARFVHQPKRYLMGQNSAGVPSVFVSSSSLMETPDGYVRPARPLISSEYEASITKMTIIRARHRITLATGSLGAPFAALRKCTDQLIAEWGLDPVQQSTLSRTPEPVMNPGRWLRSNDYPLGSLMSGRQAIVNFRLNVGSDGRSTACEVQSAYADEHFKKITCDLLMRRASFVPALDARGQPIPSFYLSTVNWVIGQ